jgi:uncharacterized membrane protein
MTAQNGRLLLLSATALLFLGAAAVLGAHASAAGVDISFTMKDTDLTCRQWDPLGGPVKWNLTLFMNGTDGSLITTPTYVWIDDTNAPAMRADSWVVILTASGYQVANPPSYDSGSSNELAIGSGVFAPSVGTLDVYLYSTAHVPPAPVTNVTVQITASEDSENKDHFFNITATTHRMGVGTITRRAPVCVHIPPKPRFDMGNTTASLQSPANNDITVSFWLKNTGNTPDWYSCNVQVPREDWTWLFIQGINVGPNITNSTNLNQNTTIRVRVHIPENALARENSTVSLNCTSIKSLQLNISVFVYPPYTRIEVTQYFYIFARITGDSTLSGVPGDQLRFDFLVQNLGNGHDKGVARIVAPSNLSWDALVSPSDYDLEPLNESADRTTAQFLVTIPLGTLIFTYDFQVNVTSASNITTPITQLRFHVQVRQVYEPVISVPEPQTGTPLQEIVFAFTIQNAGNGLDSLLIDYINLSGWRVFPDPPIGEKLLQVNEEAAFHVTVIVPNITKAQVGTYNQVVRITSKYAQLDIHANIFVEANLTIIILPHISCDLTPSETDKDVNPYDFPDNVVSANYILALNNTGNGGDALTMSAEAPPGFNVTLSPTHLQLSIFDSKAVLVSIAAPAGLPIGLYTVGITGRSDLNVQANCTSTYRLTIYHLDGALSDTVLSFIQNPEHPADVVAPTSLRVISQVEGFLVSFRVTVQNVGQRALAAHSVTLDAYDVLVCPINPIGATDNTCTDGAGRHVFTWQNPTNIIAGVGGSIQVEFKYFPPEYLCFDTDVCHRIDPPPPSNVHQLRFVLSLDHEADHSNNVANVTVEVLPKTIINRPPPAVPFPIVPVAAGVGAVGIVAFAYWYRFVRKPRVDEDLYASIYGGEGAPVAQSQTTAQYLDKQAGTEQQPAPGKPQGLTDEQVEEGRRMYGDNYGR